MALMVCRTPGVSHSDTLTTRSEGRLEIETLEKLLSLISKRRTQAEFKDATSLQSYCFKKVVKAFEKGTLDKILADVSRLIVGMRDESGRSLYQAIIEECREERVAQMLSAKSLLPSLQIEDARYALHYAARRNRVELIPKFTKVALWHEVDTEGKTPLQVAIENGSAEFVEELLKILGQNALRSLLKDRARNIELSPCALAVSEGAQECLDRLVKHGSGDCLKEGDTWGNVLHLAIWSGQTYMLEHLLTQYFDQTHGLIDKADRRGLTPLSVAAGLGDVEAMLLLANQGADCEVPDNEGMTPMHHAAKEGTP